MQKRKTVPSAGSGTVERGSVLLRITDKDRQPEEITKQQRPSRRQILHTHNCHRPKGTRENCKPARDGSSVVLKFNMKFENKLQLKYHLIHSIWKSLKGLFQEVPWAVQLSSFLFTLQPSRRQTCPRKVQTWKTRPLRYS